jgi:hypothetical protein
LAKADLAGGSQQRFGEALGVEADAGGERVLGLARHDRRAERLEPLEPIVEPLEDQPLQRLVAASALRAELLEASVAPDHAAREQHRAARPRPLLQHDRLGAELARAGSRAEAGHPGSRYHQAAAPP